MPTPLFAYSEYPSIQAAIKATEQAVIINLRKSTDWQQADFSQLAHLPHVELAFGDGPLPDDLARLARFPNIRGLRLNHPKYKLGSIPDSVRALTQLNVLVFIGCKLASLPEWLGELNQLRYLSFKDNQLTGNTLQPLFRLPHLQQLILDRNPLKTLPAEINQLEQLEYLNLSNCKIRKLPKTMGGLANLTELELHWNSIALTHIVEAIQHCPQLRRLPCYSKPLPENIGLLKQIKELQIGSDEELLPASMSQMSNLEAVDCNSARMLNWHQALPILGQLPKLKSLILPDIEEIPAEIEHLTNVWWLALGSRERPIPASIGKLTQLKSLQIGHRCLLPAEIADLQALKRVEFSEAILEDPTVIAELKSLEYISGQPTRQNVAIVGPAMAQLPNLKSLTPGGDLSGADFGFLANLASLESLTVVEQADNEVLYQALAQLPNFHILTLGSREGDQLIPPSISLLQNLRTLSMWWLKSIADLPADIATLPHVQVQGSNLTIGSVDYLNQLLRFIQQQTHWTDEQKMQCFGYATNQMSLSMENVTAWRQHPASVLYLAGQPQTITKKSLTEQLKQTNTTLAAKLSPAVTHILFGNEPSGDELAWKVEHSVVSLCEEDVKEYLNPAVDLYLHEQNAPDEMTDQVLRLLMAEELESTKLALEIIRGGGANPRLFSYLYVLQYYHPDNDVRQQAREIFKLYAPVDLLNYVKKRWHEPSRNTQKLPHYSINHPLFRVIASSSKLA